jgi:hypothetical protein
MVAEDSSIGSSLEGGTSSLDGGETEAAVVDNVSVPSFIAFSCLF